ncbi:hypothetical protein M011DRAFT_381129, partial [Sporormia fimetaria CBS 119925]
RIILLLLSWALLHVYFVVLPARKDLIEKYAPTAFSDSDLALWDAETGYVSTLLAQRDDWTVLGAGFEGKTFLHNESVIKTFTPGQSAFRNCNADHTRVPAEVLAALELGGSCSPEDGCRQSSSGNTSQAAILPVEAVFIAPATPEGPPEWHLVTPLLPGGNLHKLAERLKEEHPPKTRREVDIAFRPAFHRLLDTLHSLHSKGYCHDDVKPENVFVRTDDDWVLGDLGQVRELHHPYHSSRLWAERDQVPDCRANDAIRALKTYLRFVRGASTDPSEFNAELFQGQEPWARLWWWAKADAQEMTAAELRARSEVEHARRVEVDMSEDPVQRPDMPGPVLGNKKALAVAANRQLTTDMSESWTRLRGLVGILGLPVP